MTTSLADILLNNAFLTLTVNNKILCSITKHEMPPKVDVVLGHINGKKFKKTKEWYNYDYSEFEPYIVPDRQNSTKLHCKLTGQTLNKIPDEVKRHTIGKKFIRLKKENEELQKKQVTKERDTNSDIWVPPDELLEDEEVVDISAGAEKKSSKSKTIKGEEPAKEIEEDTFSDLLGSDHEDELDNDDDNEGDFDDVEDESKMEVVMPPVPKSTKSKKSQDCVEKAQKEKKTEKTVKDVISKDLKRKINIVEESTAAVQVKKSKKSTETGKPEKVKTVAVKKDTKASSVKGKKT